MNQGPDPLRELQPQTETSSSGLRVLVAAVAGITLIAGGGAWLNHASRPAAQQQEKTAQPAGRQLTFGAEFALIAPEHAEQALQSAGYSASDQARILAGIKRREYRLVTMPIFDASGAGGVVSVQSGVITKMVTLSQNPVSVVLPILISGEVQISPVSDPGVTGMQPGALTVLGPTLLPTIHRDEYLTMTVVAQ
ncbi:hypothetical protein J2D73_16395 [Acetobacter sacchari]|uniref:Uncharacterized protein n=1 Tax=Acetobacter sacchari TaxID=2661687 RepID=A0ABS3LZM6_9PROT|nr:hypothetical protein [Acetobacter sacchari]MBO1361367.1 hypothetical protein [Acetobacter sacchari]